MNGLLKGRITRWSMLAVVGVAAGLSLAGMGEGGKHAQGDNHFEMAGTWIGTDSANLGTATVWTGLDFPLDPTGKTVACRVAGITRPGPAFPDADTASESVGVQRMISHDTAEFTAVGYLQKAGPPLEMKAIQVMTGTWKFTGPDSAVLKFTVNIYGPSADGFPHGNPIVTIPDLTSTAKRLTLP